MKWISKKEESSRNDCGTRQYRMSERRYILLALIIYFSENNFVEGWVIRLCDHHRRDFSTTHLRGGKCLLNSFTPQIRHPAVFGLKMSSDKGTDGLNPKNGDLTSKKLENEEKFKSLESDIKHKLSMSKDRAISALSQPPSSVVASGTSKFVDNTDLTVVQRKLSHQGKEKNIENPGKSSQEKRSISSEPARARKRRRNSRNTSNADNNQNVKESKRSTDSLKVKSISAASLPKNSDIPVSTPAITPKVTNLDERNKNIEKPGSSKKVSRRYPKQQRNSSSFSSLLPPPFMETGTSSEISTTEGSNDQYQQDPLVSGLSSWEEFLGASRSTSIKSDRSSDKASNIGKNQKALVPPSAKIKSTLLTLTTPSFDPIAFPVQERATVDTDEKSRPILDQLNGNSKVNVANDSGGQQRLPSIQDLFPLDLASSSSEKKGSSQSTNPLYKNEIFTNEPKVDGAVPSRNDSRQSSYSSARKQSSQALEGISPVSDLFYRSSQSQNQDDESDDEEDEHDDEELPFSAEQSDAVSSDHNKIRIRRNMVQQEQSPPPQSGRQGNQETSRQQEVSLENKSPSASSAGTRGRKMVRRGMEMLVGGIPINADPPQRSLELFYDAQKFFEGDGAYSDWASAITLNTRDFGPIWHTGSISKLSPLERGLFCEYFCDSSIKWDVCPKDLQQLVATYKSQQLSQVSTISHEPSPFPLEDENVDQSNALNDKQTGSAAVALNATGKSRRPEPRMKGKGFSKNVLANRKLSNEVEEGIYQTKGEFSFEIALSKEELESGEGGSDGSIVKSVFVRAFMSVLERAVHSDRQDDSEDYVVSIPNLTLEETDDGYTSVTAEFKIEATFSSDLADMERRAKRIGSIFNQAMDDGDIAVAIAAAATDEPRWPSAVRERVVEECLFQDDDGDEPLAEKDPVGGVTEQQNEVELHSTIISDSVDNESSQHSLSDLFHGSGTDGVFFDYSASNVLNAPYSGSIGLRLVDAVVERAKQRQPRVIAVGDVHGCIDELQDLLRQCDYSPGDLVVLLGDLVCKGPDSISVVQMAREIGAIGVRGNHDFEVIRWHQAIKSGVDPPVVGSEHFHIASCLSKADMKWMYSLPWYISSKELGCLFVHAGFVSGIRLAKQNPRLMMNMRSILPDGTVTSKFFNNWPWARLWDGPQTVLFGHDADRGLQQYEHALGLDTGCVYGGRLTACILPEKRLVSVSARREYFKYRRKHYD